MIRIIVGTIVWLQSTLCHHPLTMESVFYSRLMIGNGYTVYSSNRRLIHPINALSFWRIGISPTATIQWLEQTKGLALTDAISQRGVGFLENLLAALTPRETVLLPNYPNPFNPETWIPYRLAGDADVQISIYDSKGVLVRQLDLGHQPAGFYTDRGRAAYWDGRNENAESVASGAYLYQLRTGYYSKMRRMVVVK